MLQPILHEVEHSEIRIISFTTGQVCLCTSYYQILQCLAQRYAMLSLQGQRLPKPRHKGILLTHISLTEVFSFFLHLVVCSRLCHFRFRFGHKVLVAQLLQNLNWQLQIGIWSYITTAISSKMAGLSMIID